MKSPNSKIDLKNLLIYGLAVFSLFFLSISIIETVQQQKYNALRINLSGKQRMLTQKLSKEILLYSLDKIPKNQIEETVNLFRATLYALSGDKDAPDDLKIKNQADLPEIKHHLTKKQLDSVVEMEKEFRKHVHRYLREKNSRSLNYIIQNNIQLLNEMDKVVTMIQETSENNTRIIRSALLLQMMLIVISLLYILLQKNKKLKTATAQIENLEKILPICAHCKKIHQDTGSEEQNSWTTVEEYISDHEKINLSHSICPECAKKYYPDMS